jgi:hypothetical protein
VSSASWSGSRAERSISPQSGAGGQPPTPDPCHRELFRRGREVVSWALVVPLGKSRIGMLCDCMSSGAERPRY